MSTYIIDNIVNLETDTKIHDTIILNVDDCIAIPIALKIHIESLKKCSTLRIQTPILDNSIINSINDTVKGLDNIKAVIIDEVDFSHMYIYDDVEELDNRIKTEKTHCIISYNLDDRTACEIKDYMKKINAKKNVLITTIFENIALLQDVENLEIKPLIDTSFLEYDDFDLNSESEPEIVKYRFNPEDECFYIVCEWAKRYACLYDGKFLYPYRLENKEFKMINPDKIKSVYFVNNDEEDMDNDFKEKIINNTKLEYAFSPKTGGKFIFNNTKYTNITNYGSAIITELDLHQFVNYMEKNPNNNIDKVIFAYTPLMEKALEKSEKVFIKLLDVMTKYNIKYIGHYVERHINEEDRCLSLHGYVYEDNIWTYLYDKYDVKNRFNTFDVKTGIVNKY